MSSYRDLEVYQVAFNLALEVYQATLKFPEFELRELSSQLRGSSRSIAANIAEGYGRRQYKKDFARFLINAIGSIDETRVHLDFALAHGYMDEKVHRNLEEQYDVLGRRLRALAGKISR